MIYEATDYWNSSYISHHGVKGMKWGVRKDRLANNPISRGIRNRKQKRLEKSDYGKAKKMSNQELQQTINRINLEQSYISAVQRDRAAYKDATRSVLNRWARKKVSSIFRTGKKGADSVEKMVRNIGINYYLGQIPMAKKPKI